MKRALHSSIPLVLAAVALTTASCSSDEPTPTSHVVAIDVSRSAAQTQLEDIGIAAVAGRLRELGGDSSVRVLAFDSAVGTSTCSTLNYPLSFENNSTKLEDDRKRLLREAPAELDNYLTCVKDEAAGKDRLTDVFGSAGAAAALLDPAAEVKTVDYISDGCHTLDPQIPTCSTAVEDPAWRSEVISSLPASRVPDLSGVEVTITGLGIGSDTQQSTIEGLRDFMTEYFTAAGAETSIQ